MFRSVYTVSLCLILGIGLAHGVDDGPKVQGENQYLQLHNEVVAQVNNDRISKRDVESRMEQVMAKLEGYKARKIAAGEWSETAQEQYNELYFPPFRDELRGIIKEKLMIQEFKAKKMEFDKQDYERRVQDTLSAMRADNQIGTGPGQASEGRVKEEIKNAMMIDEVRGEFVNVFAVPNNREVAEYYESHKNDYLRKPGDKIRRIRILRFQTDNLGHEKVVEGSAQHAEELRRQATPDTFGDLARDNSQDDPDIVKRGGVIGVKDGDEYIETGTLTGPMAAAMRGLQPGGISEIFQADEKSWAFIYYEEHREAGIRPLEGKLFEEVKKKLTMNTRNKLENEWLYRALKNALVFDAWQNPIPIKFFYPNGDMPDDSCLTTKSGKTVAKASSTDAKDPAKEAKDPKKDPKNTKDKVPVKDNKSSKGKADTADKTQANAN